MINFILGLSVTINVIFIIGLIVVIKMIKSKKDMLNFVVNKDEYNDFMK